MIKTKVKFLLGAIRAERFGIQTGKNVYIGKHCSLKGKHHITLEDCVMVRSYAQIWSRGGVVRIGKGSEIGEKVLLSPNVYITDCDHEYRNIKIPVIDQGIVQRGQKVSIGEDSYIGINTVIVGNVKIGKHCVIGANSVVTKDVPDYCVAVGSPARVIKTIEKKE